jgi:hypothetical protein
MMTRTLIQQYASSMVSGLMGRVTALKELNHRPAKGELRELFISAVLRSFLTQQFGLGSGVVVNQRGVESNQIDIVIYDNRIVPPLIREQRLGVYPAESVLATIEVKSNLTKAELLKAESAARNLLGSVYDPSASIYSDFTQFRPICAIIGFYGNGVRELADPAQGGSWVKTNRITGLNCMCLVNKWSWIIVNEAWAPQMHDNTTESNDETKRFIAVLLDNIRTRSEARLDLMRREHKDWLGAYIRDQNLFGTREA